MADVAYRLKSHLYRLLTNNLTWEYNDQIEKWKLHLETLADLNQMAMDMHVTTLQEGHAEVQRAREQAFANAMLVFQLLSLPGLAWLGTTIQNKWAPMARTRLHGALQFKTRASLNDSTKLLEHKAMDKFWGDFFRGLTQIGGTEIARRNLGPGEAPSAGFVSRASDWTSFRTGLLKEMYGHQVKIMEQLRGIANNVENDVGFGEKIVAEVVARQPGLRAAAAGKGGAEGDRQLEEAGQRYIHEQLNEARKKWAADWYLYGYDPPELTPLKVRVEIERQIWANWILSVDLKVMRSQRWNYGVQSRDGELKGEGWYHIGTDDKVFQTTAVQRKLEWLGTPMNIEGGQVFPVLDRDHGLGTVGAMGEEWQVKMGLEQLFNWAFYVMPERKLVTGGKKRENLVPVQHYVGPSHRTYKTGG